MPNAAGLRQRFPVFLLVAVHWGAVPLAMFGRGIVFVRCSGGFGTVAKFFRLPIEGAFQKWVALEYKHLQAAPQDQVTSDLAAVCLTSVSAIASTRSLMRGLSPRRIALYSRLILVFRCSLTASHSAINIHATESA